MSMALASQHSFLVFGRQSRHGACDRCRGQKLRCRYAGSAERGVGVGDRGGSSTSDAACLRCRRMGAECIQSPSVRAGRPLHSGTKGSRKSAARERVGSSNEAATRQTASSPPRECTGDRRGNSPSDTTLMTGGLSLAEPLDFDFDFDFDFDAMETAAFDWPKEVEGDLSSSSPMVCDEKQLFPLSTAPASDDDIFCLALSDPSTQANPGLTFAEHAGEEDAADEDTRAVMDTAFQKLHDLAMSLYKLSADTAHTQPRMDYPIDGILSTTQTFVEVLSVFLPSSSPAACISADPPENANHAFHARAHARAHAHDHDHDHHSRRPDIHTILIIISCHTRLMRIYSNLILHVHEGFSSDGNGNGDEPATRAPAPAPAPAPTRARVAGLPDLKLGKMHISQDSSLQALLLVQVGVHMIERVDRLLRSLLDLVGRASLAGGNGGGLDGSGVRSILDAAISQEDYESRLSGRRGIRSLKGDISMLEQLLRRW